MKNVLIFLSAILISFSSFSLNAQIKRVIGGVSLGVTTKSQLLSKLKSRHKHYVFVGDNLLRVDGDCDFAGVRWFATFYHFHHGRVFKISYSKHANSYDVPETLIDTEYSALEIALNGKYRRFKTTDDSGVPCVSSACFKDRKTMIRLHKRYYVGYYILTLDYVDFKIQMQHYLEQDDEL